MSISKLTKEEWIARDAKSLATSLVLSEGLFTVGGYRLETLAHKGPGQYFVRKPKPDFDRKTGEVLVEGYRVDILAGTCSCPLFVRLAEWAHLPGREDLQPNCKHLRATLGALRDAYTLFAPFIGADLSRLLAIPQAAHTPQAAHAPQQAAPTPKPKDCPLCGGELLSLAAQGFASDFACTRCGRTHDEASLMRADDAILAPAPKVNRHTETTFRQRGGRGVPACKKCFTAMDAAVNEHTGQEGHRCAVCGDFLPLGSLRPIPAPQGYPLTVSY